MDSGGKCDLPEGAISERDRGQGPSWTGPQLEPERNFLIEYAVVAGVWSPLASIEVGATTESWTVDRQAAASFFAGNVGAIRLRLWSGTAPTIPNAYRESAATVVTWTAATSPSYLTPGYTFSGGYAYAGGAGKLAITLQLVQVTGGAAIAASFWCNPDPRGSAISLASTAVTVNMAATSGAYAGACVTTTSTYS